MTLPLVIGHGPVLDRLLAAARSDRLHHALLIEGPEGVGKRTVALRVAMEGVCTHADPAHRPCGRCEACEEALHVEARHPDIVHVTPEADAKTPTIKVDRIRELVAHAGFTRWKARRRTYIIDPADAMNEQAQNALLKVLEEPNAGTAFILLTSRPRMLLPTIHSRCQHVRLSPVPEATLIPWLDARGVPDAAHVARLADGRPGAALALADGDALAARRADRDALLQAVAGGPKRWFDHVESLTKRSKDRTLQRAIVATHLALIDEIVRDATAIALGHDDALLHDDLRPALARAAAAAWPDGLAEVADAVDDARQALRLNLNARAVLDAVVVRLVTALGPAREAFAAPPAP